jgi:hypothetical protein
VGDAHLAAQRMKRQRSDQILHWETRIHQLTYRTMLHHSQ